MVVGSGAGRYNPHPYYLEQDKKWRCALKCVLFLAAHFQRGCFLNLRTRLMTLIRTNYTSLMIAISAWLLSYCSHPVLMDSNVLKLQGVLQKSLSI